MEGGTFLEGDQVVLRPLFVEDVEGNYINWLNDPVINEHNSHHVFPYTRAQALNYIESVSGDKQNLVLAIVAKDSGKHIGNISLQKIDQISKNAEYAILIGEKDYWGKGIAQEASRLLLRHGFEALNLHRVYCGTSNTNIAMQKLAHTLGMKQEGVRREAHYKNGSYADIIEYGLLKNEFVL